jgi:hypothetical protein
MEITNGQAPSKLNAILIAFLRAANMTVEFDEYNSHSRKTIAR